MKQLLDIFFNLPEKIRFILVGGLNTGFHIILFAIMYMTLKIQVHYIVILLASYLISILFSYFSLKILVFRTIGNVKKELARCYVAYSIMLLLNAFLLFLAVDIINFPTIPSQICITINIAILSFVIHKLFSFKIN